MAMASSSLLTPHINSLFCPKPISQFPCLPLLSSTHSFKPNILQKSPSNNQKDTCFVIKAQTFDFQGSFFEGGGFGSEDDPSTSQPESGIATAVLEDKEEIQCPPGLRQYETMVVLRPDMSEDERLALTQKYEELLIAGGGMYVEVFNRGVIPLAYGIKKKNKAGESNTYLDGIYLLYTYFTKPDSIEVLEATLKADDNIIRSSSFKIRKRKY
ncbi:Ribosomal_S6 domain-containing protein [Cephalotus follicularis]|uniref:Ribosomal_S6 domain-containing protein n=1 Tax=Cephalotus follicularis TaxID=3775 RepID=A0A1Q3BL15_CEPFO|nr:Ribosomal_S6 domain-containing protein [Cephalotus follicularis]